MMSDGPDIRSDVAGSDRRDEDLGHADRQRAHRRRDQRTAARSAGRNEPADRFLAPNPGLERFGHRGDRGAAFAGEDGVWAAAKIRRDMVRRHVGRRRSAGGGKIDQDHPHAGGGDLVADEAEFGAFGIERSCDNHRRRAAAVDRSQLDRRGAAPLVAGSGAAVCVRAAVSIWAAGTGCDHRVGMVGFET